LVDELRAFGKPISGIDTCQTLTPKDEFSITVDLTGARPESYAYLFLADSAGNWKVLLPNKAYSNPLRADKYTVPDLIDFKGRLHPPSRPGVEKLFLVVARWRIPVWEDLSSSLAAETDPNRARDLGDQVEARLKLENAKPASLKGLKLGDLEFNDSGSQ
jgi:hypothetical protein